MSISEGFQRMKREFLKLGCEALQIFVVNPRSWKGKRWREEEVLFFKENFNSFPCFTHLSYLPNLASGRKKDLARFFEEIELSLELGIESIVVHPGSRKEKEEGMISLAKALDEALSTYDLNIFLENSAGDGNSLGSSIDELEKIFSLSRKREKLRICLDTAHIFQSGVDIRRKEVLDELIEKIKKVFGEGTLGLIHLNDSKTDLGSKVDRHWHIGMGRLGKETIREILNHPGLNDLCAVMETPKMGKMDEYNMSTVRELLLPLVPHSLS